VSEVDNLLNNYLSNKLTSDIDLYLEKQDSINKILFCENILNLYFKEDNNDLLLLLTYLLKNQLIFKNNITKAYIKYITINKNHNNNNNFLLFCNNNNISLDNKKSF